MENLESRVTELEIQISFQMKMLEELNSSIILQQKQIKNTEEITASLVENLHNSTVSDTQSLSTYFDKKPPHY